MTKLRASRKGKGLTLEQASREVGIHFASLSRIERGHQTPSPKVALRLCEAYGITLDEIYQKDLAA